MEFQNLIEKRRSVRKYVERNTVTKDEILSMIKAAQEAPSWKNSQTGRYYCIMDEKNVEQFRRECLPEMNAGKCENAVLLVSTFVHNRAGFQKDGTADNEIGNGWGCYDLGMQNENLILKAEELGYGTLIMGISAALFALVNPFITLWVGESYLLEEKVVFIVCLNLYMRLIRNTFLTFNDTYGMFKQLKPKCIAEAIINLTVSLLFVGPMKMGIYGVLLGTFVSNITTNFWYEPYLLFKKFGVSLKKYFLLFGEYILLTVISAGTMFWICNYVIALSGWIGFFLKVAVTCICINLFYIVVFARTDEFKYFLGIVKAKIKR